MKKFMSVLLLIVFVAFSAVASDDDKIKKNKQVKSEEQVDNNLMEIAVQTDFLSTLVKAIQAGDLAATLQGDGPFTIFAPTNEAFNKLPPGTLEELMQPANRVKLQEILNNHVVEGRIMSKDLTDGQKATGLGNKDLNIRKAGNQITVNGAKITTPDVQASNGVIHIVDTLILSRR